jgi:ABC-type dipeptide/oligopeptide/nickel transport system permease component
MIEVMGEDYILAARAKGLSESKVVYKHAFRNAILPIFTITGMYFALLLGGSVLTETIFSLPGMGSLLLGSVGNRDYTMIQACVVVYAISIMIVTTVIDITYVFLDPRIRV